MKIDIQSIDKLIEAPYNPRKDLKPGDKEYDKLKQSIEHFGYVEPIIVNDKTGYIVGGHQRLKVLKDLGYNEVEVVHVDLDENNEKALNIALNKVSGEWDADKLEDLLRELNLADDFNVEFTGFDLSELDTMFSGAIESLDSDDTNKESEDDKDEPDLEDNNINKNVSSRVNSGDIWQLGDHVLICGDSTNEDTYKALMGNSVADLVFTDPPYDMKKEADGVANDNLNHDDLLEFNKKWIPLSFKYTSKLGSWYCWGIDEPLMDIYSNILKPMIKANKITFRNLITWNKGSDQNQNNEQTRMYAVVDEKCLFVMCGVQGFNNNADNYYEGWEPIRQYLFEAINKAGITKQKIKEITGVDMYAHWFTKSQWCFIPEKHYIKLKEYCELNQEYCELNQEYCELKQEYDKIKKEWYDSGRSYFNNTHDNMNNVWEFNRCSGQERSETGGHATPKPLALCARAIKSSSREGNIVLDCFGGSGSTLIACEELGRSCRMIELEPHWCDVIINRWESKTGKTAEFIRNVR